WLDDEHLAVYLLDVCGHGVGAALLAVSVMNVLRAQALPRTDFRDPGRVLEALNEAFPMGKQDGKDFPIWSGVYPRPGRKLRYSGGGHPSPLLFTGPDPGAERLEQLKSRGPGVGMWEGAPFETAEMTVGASGRLFLYSDGAFEISQVPDGAM